MGFSSGEYGGSFTSVILSGTYKHFAPCQPAPLTMSMACAPCPVRDRFCDLIEVQPHCLRVNVRQDQPCGGATGGTGGTEDIAPLITRSTRCAGAGSAPRPFARKCFLLPNTGFILELYSRGLPFACSGMTSTTRLAKFF
jgi:hypothetical protein